MIMAERTGGGSCLLIASAVAVAAIVFCLGRGSLLPFVGLQQDDGHYLVAARSIAEGWGYRAAQAPGKPWQTKFPPVFPLSLSVGWSLSSDWPAVAHWQALETLTFGAIAAGLLCLVMVRTASLSNPLAALATVAGGPGPALLADDGAGHERAAVHVVDRGGHLVPERSRRQPFCQDAWRLAGAHGADAKRWGPDVRGRHRLALETARARRGPWSCRWDSPSLAGSAGCNSRVSAPVHRSTK